MKSLVLASALGILIPPASYLPYTGPLCRVEVAQPSVASICWNMGVKVKFDQTIYGCAKYVHGGCVEIVAITDDPVERKALHDHEDAHCNGWVHP